MQIKVDRIIRATMQNNLTAPVFTTLKKSSQINLILTKPYKSPYAPNKMHPLIPNYPNKIDLNNSLPNLINDLRHIQRH